jgi:hypothetical protein
LLLRGLQFADDAQQAFSGHSQPTLAYVIPALEQLFKHWKMRCNKPAYAQYHNALNAGLTTVNEYYTWTEDSDTFIMAMGTYMLILLLIAPLWLPVLDPTQKFEWIKKNWEGNLKQKAEDFVNKLV